MFRRNLLMSIGSGLLAFSAVALAEDAPPPDPSVAPAPAVPPEEKKPDEAKPAETPKAEETKPAETKPAETAKPAEEAPKAEVAKVVDIPKDDKKEVKTDKDGRAPVVDPDPEYAARTALAKARAKAKEEIEIRALVRRLTTPGWKEAQGDLIAKGTIVVPYLIEAMADTNAKNFEAYSYDLQAPMQATRQRPINEIAYEVLYNLISNHTSFDGELPGRDAKAWADFWTANADKLLAHE